MSFRRWAVICSKEAQDAGLGDLVTTELSKSPDLELVDREQLKTVANELQLATVLESKSAAERLKMGQLLKADALLLLGIGESDEGRKVKAVVSECRCGARLRVEYLPYDQRARADLSRRCAEIVANVREHFAGGIRHIVGVSPLMSKSLVHDYDNLQEIYARLLEMGLLQLPNVAVIETEEARTMGQEAGLAASAAEDRPAPLLLEGEFTVLRGEKGKRDVQFEFTCQDAGGRRRTIRPLPMPLDATARFISNELPRQILPPNAAEPVEAVEAVSAEEQAQWLIERGTAFAQVGSWDEAKSLFEAAVLLTPDDFSLRLKLLGGYSHFLKVRGPWLSGRQKSMVRKYVPYMIECHLAYLSHLEYLIRNRRLNAVQALTAFEGPSPFCIWPGYHDYASNGSSLLFRDLFEPMAEAEERFVHDVYPQILQLPPGRPGENPEFSAIYPTEVNYRIKDLQENWLHGLVSWFVKERASSVDPTPRDLDFLFRMLTEVVPDPCGTPSMMIQFLDRPLWMRNSFGQRTPGAMTDDDWIAFLRRLAASKHHMANFYGRYGLMHRKLESHLTHLQDHELAESLLTEVNAWLKDYAAIDNRPPYPNGMDGNAFHDAVAQWRNGLAWQLNQPKEETANQPVRGRTEAAGKGVAANKVPASAAKGNVAAASGPRNSRLARGGVAAGDPSLVAAAKLAFEEIPITGMKSGSLGPLIACGDQGDVAWQAAHRGADSQGRQAARVYRDRQGIKWRVLGRKARLDHDAVAGNCRAVAGRETLGQDHCGTRIASRGPRHAAAPPGPGQSVCCRFVRRKRASMVRDHRT